MPDPGRGQASVGGGRHGLRDDIDMHGHGVARLVIFHLITSRSPRSAGSPGLKKVFPLKWSDTGSVIGPS